VRARAWGGGAVGGGNRRDWEEEGAVGPLLRGTPMQRRPEGLGRRSKGAGPLEPWKSRGLRSGARFKWVAKLEAQQTNYV